VALSSVYARLPSASCVDVGSVNAAVAILYGCKALHVIHITARHTSKHVFSSFVSELSWPKVLWHTASASVVTVYAICCWHYSTLLKSYLLRPSC
jgi:hypothetical protein